MIEIAMMIVSAWVILLFSVGVLSVLWVIFRETLFFICDHFIAITSVVVVLLVLGFIWPDVKGELK